MCGIIGYIGKKDCKDILLDCLKKLEYRGYDSSGVSFANKNNYEIIKSSGKILNLEEKLKERKINNPCIGIGHTRWATHGVANDINAHPHEGKTCILVHNGIIENYEILKNDFDQIVGYDFSPLKIKIDNGLTIPSVNYFSDDIRSKTSGPEWEKYLPYLENKDNYVVFLLRRRDF